MVRSSAIIEVGVATVTFSLNAFSKNAGSIRRASESKVSNGTNKTTKSGEPADL